MALKTERVCDECGAPATQFVRGMTGRVIIDGRDCGQDADLCDEHQTAPDYQWQPQRATRVLFWWSGRHGENMYPKRAMEGER